MSNLLPAERRAFEVAFSVWEGSQVDSDWGQEAACRESLGSGLDPYEYGDQKQFVRGFCHNCPVVEACAAQAEAYRERDGVWGGVAYRNGKRFRVNVEKVYDDGSEKLTLVPINRKGEDITPASESNNKTPSFIQLAFELANK
jgi:hypothetical protein